MTNISHTLAHSPIHDAFSSQSDGNAGTTQFGKVSVAQNDLADTSSQPISRTNVDGSSYKISPDKSGALNIATRTAQGEAGNYVIAAPAPTPRPAQIVRNNAL